MWIKQGLSTRIFSFLWITFPIFSVVRLLSPQNAPFLRQNPPEIVDNLSTMHNQLFVKSQYFCVDNPKAPKNFSFFPAKRPRFCPRTLVRESFETKLSTTIPKRINVKFPRKRSEKNFPLPAARIRHFSDSFRPPQKSDRNRQVKRRNPDTPAYAAIVL